MVGVRLVVTPDASTRLATAHTWLAGHPADADVLVVAPSREIADECVRRAAMGGRARFGVVRTTLRRLADDLARRPLAVEGLAPAPALSLTALVARAVHRLATGGALGRFTPVQDHPGFPAAIERTIAEVRLAGLDVAALRRAGGAMVDLATVMEATLAELAADGLVDPAGVMETARRVVRDAAAAPVGVPLLLFDVAVESAADAGLVAALAARAPSILATVPRGDARSLTALERALGVAAESHVGIAPRNALERLQQHLFEESAPPATPLDDGVRLAAWPGEARECVEVVRAVQAEAARGVPFDRMAVALHAAQDYVPHLEEAFARAGVPCVFARGTTKPYPSGRALLALLACAGDGLSARSFAEYLSLGQVPDPDGEPLWVPPERARADDEPIPEVRDADPEPVDDPAALPAVAGTLHAPRRWEQLVVEAAVIGGVDRWERRLTGLAHDLEARRAALGGEDENRAAAVDRDLRDLAHLRGFALPVIRRLARLPALARWGEWITALRALAAAALRDPGSVLATLAELEPMATVGPVDLDEVRLVLTPRLRDRPVPPPRRRYGAVLIAPTWAMRGTTFDVVFVPGLAENLFPAKIVEDPILLDVERERLASDALLRQADRSAAERLALRLAVGAATARVYLSYPRVDVEKARPRVPSFYALEVLRAAEGRLPGFDELGTRATAAARARLGWPAPERPADAIDEAEYDLALLAPLLDADPETTIGTASYLLGANPHLARALRARGRRWIRRWTTADGLVDPGGLGAEALARHQLTTRPFSPTALQHFAACPYRFFLYTVHRLAPRDEPGKIELMDPLTRGTLVHDVQFEVLTRLRAEGLLPLSVEHLSRALAMLDDVLDAEARHQAEELAPAIPRVWEDGVDAVRADLHEWLRRAAQMDDGWIPDRFELSFAIGDRDRAHADPASVPEPVPVLGGLRLRGAIDLVERHRDGRLRVTDHKSGKVSAPEGVVVGGGQVLQPVLYALAAESLLGAPVTAGRLYYCTAAGEFTERSVPIDPTTRQHAETVVGVIGDALERGFLPAAPAPRACQWCDYRIVCGPYEEIRVARKPPERLSALAMLRGLP